MSAHPTIAFIGLGNMGLPMATNLVRAGFPVKGFDLVADNTSAFDAAGGTVADSLPAALAGAKVVITMLPAGAHVNDVVCGRGGVLEQGELPDLILDCSTIDVAEARAISARAAKAGIDMLDAPVSGGIMGARNASLTFMCGGEEKAFEKARPLLDAMGSNVIHAGGSGNGQAAKVCNNMLLGISMIGVSEAFNLADGLGLDRQTLFDISSRASGQCWSLTSYCPVPGPVPASPANNGYAPGFSAAMMLKDLRLARGAADASEVATPLGEHARQLYEAFLEQGGAEKDFSGIINFLREKSSES
ncbi:MAG TPA: 3-hydroxyisobutyrate dehydrogenase [Devosia sp.]|nr:3-hydroxyisobutyrate dehydrogenase [Devosia sp.]